MLRIHLIPNAHLDIAWLWDWREGLNEGVATCRAVVSLMEEYNDITFTRGEAFIYEHIEKHDPDLFARITRLIEMGRWEITGGTLLQPDNNLGKGETYVRQFLYGQQYFHNHFGIIPEIAYNVDSFGHAAGLPSIYRAAGCRFAVQRRPFQKYLPTSSRLFRWQGSDGSEIITANVESYGLELEETDPAFTLNARIRREIQQVPEGLHDWIMLIGFGDHGGGLNHQLVNEIYENIAHPPESCELRLSTLGQFFANVEEYALQLPVIEGELQFYARGCYTSAATVKSAYHEAENLVNCAERWASVADILDQAEYPGEAIKKIWSGILFNQAHDILPGTAIERVCNEALDHLGCVRHEAKSVANDAALPVFLDIDTSVYEGMPVLLFNPHGTSFSGPIELEWLLEYRPLSSGDGERRIRYARAIAPDGKEVPIQFLPTEVNIKQEWRVRGCFMAQIPACGYAVYWLQPTETPLLLPEEITAGEKNDERFISNKYICIAAQPGKYGIQVRDVKSRKQWLDDGAAGIVLEDMGNLWGSGIDSWDKVSGKFRITEVHILQKGPIKATLLVISRYGCSCLIQEFTLYQGLKRIDCQARLVWNEPNRLCKLEFPIDGENLKALFSAPYAVIERVPEIGEVPCNGWVAIFMDNGDGIGLAATGKYGFNIIGNKLRMSVVRSPLCGNKIIDERHASPERPFMDIGTHIFKYTIVPAKNISQAARELNIPIHITLGFPHVGKLPPSQSVISVTSDDVVLTALKKAEDGHGWMLRLWEETGVEREANIYVLGQAVGMVKLCPWQLLTVRLFVRKQKWVMQSDSLMERRSLEDQEFTFNIEGADSEV